MDDQRYVEPEMRLLYRRGRQFPEVGITDRLYHRVASAVDAGIVTAPGTDIEVLILWQRQPCQLLAAGHGVAIAEGSIAHAVGGQLKSRPREHGGGTAVPPGGARGRDLKALGRARVGSQAPDVVPPSAGEHGEPAGDDHLAVELDGQGIDRVAGCPIKGYSDVNKCYGSASFSTSNMARRRTSRMMVTSSSVTTKGGATMR